MNMNERTVSIASRDNVAFRVDMRSKCRVCIRCFDRNYIWEYIVSSYLKSKEKSVSNYGFRQYKTTIRQELANFT